MTRLLILLLALITPCGGCTETIGFKALHGPAHQPREMPAGVWHMSEDSLATAPDPRLTLISFLKAIRRHDKEAALACWMNDVEDPARKQYVADMVHLFVKEMIARDRLEHALARKAPDLYQHVRKAAAARPEPDSLKSAPITYHGQHAVIQPGPQEDRTLKMILEAVDPANPVWKISMAHWEGTTRPDVLDSMMWRMGAEAMDRTTRDVRSGRVRTIGELEAVFERHLNELQNAEDAGC
jgi:hypothetical protein